MTNTNTYKPDYAAPPGWILEEYLDTHAISHAAFARRCGRSAKLISDIISGKAPLEPETALQFEKVLGMDASIWAGIEADYQLRKARNQEAIQFQNDEVWYKKFPIPELINRGYFQKPINGVDGVGKLLAFFGVASVDVWSTRFAVANISYRHSPSFKSSNEALATWLRIGELEAVQQDCEEYGATAFRAALQKIRTMTSEVPNIFLPEVQKLCNDSGVAFVVVKSLQKIALSGAAWWLTPRKAIIQLSLRHMSDDHLWFSFFHEAAHLLLHSKRDVFVEEQGGNGSGQEKEANDWAANFLVPREQYEAFKRSGSLTQSRILEFAQEQEIAPGIVVGLLQHEEFVPWKSQLNKLKRRYKWNN